MTRYLLTFLFFALPVNAAVRTANSPSLPDVQAQVGMSVDGDTVVVPAGTAVWNSRLVISGKSVSLIGAGTNSITGTTIINRAGNLLWVQSVGHTPWRMSGFRFDQSGNLAAQNVVIMTGPSYSNRVDNCNWLYGDWAVTWNPFLSGGNTATGPVEGVIDHCLFYNMSRAIAPADVRTTDGGVDGSTAWTLPMQPGTIHNMYAEDCWFPFDAGISVYANPDATIYGNPSGGSIVLRYCTFTGANFNYLDGHGDVTAACSTRLYEIYNNTFTHGAFGPDGVNYTGNQRGGSWIFHDNVGTGLPYGMRLWNYCATLGHPVTNSYFWNNTFPTAAAYTFDAPVTCGPTTQPVLNLSYFLHAPQAGQTFFGYTPFTYPHPLVNSPTNPPPPDIPVLAYPTFHPGDGLIQPAMFASNHFLISPTPNSGLAQMRIVIPTNDLYQLYMSAIAQGTDSNSVWINWNSDPTGNDQQCYDIPVAIDYATNLVTRRGFGTTWALPAGTNTLWISGREPIGIDTITITPYVAPPPPPPPPGIAHLSMDPAGITAATTPGSVQTANVYRSGETNTTVSVAYYTLDGTALSNRNYTATSGSLIFNPGVTNNSISLTILSDPVDRGTLNFNINLGITSTNADLITPTNELVALFPGAPPPPPPPIAYLQFNQAKLDGAQTASTLFAQVNRFSYTGTTSTVQYVTVDGTARAGTNYVFKSGTLTFLPSETSKMISLSILPTFSYQGNIAFYLALFNPSSGTQIQPPVNLLVDLSPAAPFPPTVILNGTLLNGIIE